jgi:hypothetical protein
MSFDTPLERSFGRWLWKVRIEKIRRGGSHFRFDVRLAVFQKNRRRCKRPNGNVQEGPAKAKWFGPVCLARSVGRLQAAMVMRPAATYT